MWQAPNSRIHVPSGKQRGKKSLHIKRVHAEIKAAGSEDPTLINARAVLNDMHSKGTCVFVSQPLGIGLTVALTIQEPKRIYANAQVVGCQEFNSDHKVLTLQPFGYRVALQFIFESAEEEAAMRAYVEYLNKEHVQPSIRTGS